MLTTTAQRKCAICGLDGQTLPEWAQDLDTAVEQAPGVYRCASTDAPILPPLAKLSKEESERLEHELQLFAWLSDRAIPEQRIRPMKTAADVVAVVERINGWAEATGTVIYKLRHWPLGRAVVLAYGRTEGTRCC